MVHRAIRSIPLLLAVILPGCSKPPAPPPPSQQADVIVIGAGISGLSAAIEAAEADLSVLVADMGSVFGGHAVVAAGVLNIPNSPMQAERGIEDSIELARQDFIRWGEDPDQHWVDYYVNHAKVDIYDWVTGLGVNFFTVAQPAGNSVPRVHVPEGFGLNLVTRIYQEALSHEKIAFLWNTRADQLLVEDGRITGISTTQTRSGNQQQLRASAVVIATGGFQSNLQRVLDNWPGAITKPTRILAGSGVHSMGSGLDLATEVGAKLHRMDHQWNYVTGMPNPGFPGTDRGLSFFAKPGKPRFDIWVNDNGERFANECQSAKHSLPRLLQQPGQRYWSVFDSTNKPNMTISGPGWTPERLESEIYGNSELVKIADSLEELAQLTRIPADSLVQTVAHYNNLVASGVDPDQGRFGKTGKQGNDGNCGTPRRLEKPPYYAVRLYPLSRKSMGGVKVDDKTRVLDHNDQPIPGLYAVGEASGFAGINGKAGLEGTFLGPSIVTGRVAGRTLANTLTSTVPEPQRPASHFSIHPTTSQSGACLDCHALDQQMAAHHQGYEHFGYVHTLVQQRNLPCQACHAELYPYRADGHQWREQSKIQACAVCHGGGD
ncbi:FAD-dependent oxidoreductase [Porticoccus sp. GXU_MW_L64]